MTLFHAWMVLSVGNSYLSLATETSSCIADQSNINLIQNYEYIIKWQLNTQKKKKTLNSVEVIDNLNTFNNPNGGRDKLRQRERRELTRLKERCVCEGQNGDRHEVDHWLAVACVCVCETHPLLISILCNFLILVKRFMWFILFISLSLKNKTQVIKT